MPTPASPPARADLVQAGVLAPYLRLLRHSGLDVEHLFQRCHIPTGAIDEPGVWLAKAQVYALAARAARFAGVPQLGGLAGTQLKWEELGRFGHAIRQSTTLLEAGRMAHLAIGSVVSGADCWVEQGRFGAWFCYRPEMRFDPGAAQTEQFDLAMLLKFVRSAAGPDWRPHMVRTVACSAEVLRRLNDFADTEVIPDTVVTAIGLPNELLSRPITAGDATMTGPSDDASPPDGASLTRSISWLIESLFPYLPAPGMETVAEMLAMHPRQMQRLLAAEQMTYKRLLEQVRYRMAVHLLTTSNLPIKEIAFNLGYSGTNNFTRAFQRLAGMPPTTYRHRI